MFKIAVLISGSGSNLQAIIDAVNTKYLNCSIEAVISSSKSAYGLERAKANGIETYVLENTNDAELLSNNVLQIVQSKNVDIIVLAGFLKILSGPILKIYENKIVNIHPSLIPSFCGSGMYGIKVHEKALEYGVKVSGCTVHFVNNETDGGPIILQKSVPVYSSDSAKTLQERILVEEHTALVEAVKLISEGKTEVKGRTVFIR